RLVARARRQRGGRFARLDGAAARAAGERRPRRPLPGRPRPAAAHRSLRPARRLGRPPDAGADLRGADWPMARWRLPGAPGTRAEVVKERERREMSAKLDRRDFLTMMGA